MLDLIINPFITILLVLYSLTGDVFLSIVGFTVLIRMALMPLTLKQYSSMKAIQEVQPLLKEMQEKYKDNREVLMQKQMELYREHKVNPLMSCLPLIVQLPILIGLWRAIIAVLASTPGQLLSLSDRILIPGLVSNVPMNNQFLWLNLAVPDPYIILPILVVITTWLQQKLLTPPMPKPKPGQENDPSAQAANMTRQMTTIMPIMFGFFALSYSSGLSIYFIVSNIIGVGQAAAMGRADFGRLLGKQTLTEDEQEELEKYGRRRIDGISDTREAKTKYEPAQSNGTSEKRSQRLKRARAKAKSVRVSSK